jgi:hypothetical protein
MHRMKLLLRNKKKVLCEGSYSEQSSNMLLYIVTMVLVKQGNSETEVLVIYF